MSFPAFENMPLWTRVCALRDITTKNRTMHFGEIGTVVERWAYMVGVRPDGKKLTVQTADTSALKVISGKPPNLK